MPLSDPIEVEYVPLRLNGAVPAPLGTESEGKERVTVVLAPGARFVTAAGAKTNEPEPKVVPLIETCSVPIVTSPVFVIVTTAT